MVCLISDFDGTFYDDNFINNINSVKNFINDENIFVIATGRVFESIKDKTRELDIPYSYLICSDGAVIYDKNDQVIYNKHLDNNIKDEIVNKLQSDKRVSLINLDNNCKLIECSSNDASRIVAKTYMEKDSYDIIDELKRTYPNLKIYKSPNWINVSFETKDNAIKYLESIINLDKLYVIGDSENDIEMIEKYNGYIMAKNTIKFNHNYKVVSSVEDLINIIKTSKN